MRLKIFALALAVGLSFGCGLALADYEADSYVTNTVIAGDRSFIPINKPGSPDHWRRMIPLILTEFEIWYPDVWKGPDSNGIKMYKATVQMQPEAEGKNVFVVGIWLGPVTQNESNKYRFGAKDK